MLFCPSTEAIIHIGANNGTTPLSSAITRLYTDKVEGARDGRWVVYVSTGRNGSCMGARERGVVYGSTRWVGGGGRVWDPYTIMLQGDIQPTLRRHVIM